MKTALGVDIGTSKIALVILTKKRELLHTTSFATNAYKERRETRAEQSTQQLLTALTEGVRSLPADLRRDLCAVGITGQMHGVLLWQDPVAGSPTSPLYTWEDRRCAEAGFLDVLRRATGEHSVSPGFGLATLAWLKQNDPGLLKQFSQAATIQDYIAALLCELKEGITDPSDAASWGFFDVEKLIWREAAIRMLDLPTQLPRLLPMGSIAGKTKGSLVKGLGLPEGLPVFVPIGDNQASLYATILDPAKDLALTLGTGGQISVVLNSFPKNQTLPASVEIRPYFEGQYLAVATALCGGSALRWLADSLKEITADLGGACPAEPQLFALLDRLAQQNLDSTLNITASFQGERFDPQLRGSISGIDLRNFTLGNLAAALGRGILEGLKDRQPAEFLSRTERVVGSGNALQHLAFMRALVPVVFGKPLLLKAEREEAAIGAALQALDRIPE